MIVELTHFCASYVSDQVTIGSKQDDQFIYATNVFEVHIQR